MKDSIERMMEMIRAKDIEIFLVESYYNRYQPAPPEGYFAMRSHKRRLFIPLKNGSSMPHPEKINHCIKSGEYIEHLLCDTSISNNTPNTSYDYQNYLSGF